MGVPKSQFARILFSRKPRGSFTYWGRLAKIQNDGIYVPGNWVTYFIFFFDVFSFKRERRIILYQRQENSFSRAVGIFFVFYSHKPSPLYRALQDLLFGGKQRKMIGKSTKAKFVHGYPFQDLDIVWFFIFNQIPLIHTDYQSLFILLYQRKYIQVPTFETG